MILIGMAMCVLVALWLVYSSDTHVLVVVCFEMWDDVVVVCVCVLSMVCNGLSVAAVSAR